MPWTPPNTNLCGWDRGGEAQLYEELGWEKSLWRSHGGFAFWLKNGQELSLGLEVSVAPFCFIALSFNHRLEDLGISRTLDTKNRVGALLCAWHHCTQLAHASTVHVSYPAAFPKEFGVRTMCLI